MSRQIVHSDAAPAAIGPYSQAVRVDRTVYLSGQLPVDPATGKLVQGSLTDQARQVFRNLQAVCKAAGGDLSDAVRVGIFLTDLSHFSEVNAVMGEFFSEPYPARATIQVAALPLGGEMEVEMTLVLD